MKYQHVDPEEAVRIHIDVQAKKSIGIHWGTFALANEVRITYKWCGLQMFGLKWKDIER